MRADQNPFVAHDASPPNDIAHDSDHSFSAKMLDLYTAAWAQPIAGVY